MKATLPKDSAADGCIIQCVLNNIHIGVFIDGFIFGERRLNYILIVCHLALVT